MGTKAARAQGRHRVRIVVAATIALLTGVLCLTVAAPPTAQADDNGDALLEIFDELPASYEYGQDLSFQGAATDVSLSCLSPPFDCDEPGGYVYIEVDDGSGRLLADAPLRPYGEGNGDLSFWGPMVLSGNKLGPGTYLLYFGMESTFRPTGYSWTVTVRRIACSVTLTQSTPASNPNDDVTFTATITGNGDHSGPMTFTDDDGDLLATPDIVDGKAVFTTGALPQGSTTVHATWANGNPTIYDTCSSAVVHQVSSDPAPAAVDDVYQLDAGETIVVHPLANDYDVGPGPLRAEYLDSPDLGDAESLDVNGTSLQFTAPDDTIGETQMHYLVYDGIGQSSNEGTINFVIGCEPVARDDFYSIDFETPSTIDAAAGPGANDDRCDLPTEVVDQPTHGTLDYDDGGGGFTYTPAAGFAGLDSFTYRYSEGLESPVDGTVRLYVNTPTETTEPPTTTTTTAPTSTSTTTAPTSTSTTTTSTTTTTTPAIPGSEATVSSWYQALLDRAPDPGGLGYWSSKLDAGTRPLVVTRQMVSSREFRRRVVRDAYRQCLGRAPDPGGLTFWSDRLARGTSPEDVRVAMLASSEAWRSAGRDPVAWAGVVYDALVGRLPSASERSSVVDRLHGGATRAQIARSVARSAEASAHLASFWYQEILGRSPTSSEIADWRDQLYLGLDPSVRPQSTISRELTLVAELASTIVGDVD